MYQQRQQTSVAHAQQQSEVFYSLTDKEVLEGLARYGHTWPELERVTPIQWGRIAVMLDMVETCLHVGFPPRLLFFKPEFLGAHTRKGWPRHNVA